MKSPKTFDILALIGLLPSSIIAGCGDPPSGSRGDTQHFTIQSGSHTREYLVHLPSNYDESKDTALIVSYHGTSSNMHTQETLSQFSNETLNPNMIAVYPNGEKTDKGDRTWDGPAYAKDEGARAGVDDRNFTTQLLNQLKADYCIDSRRIYATGKSVGGGFVNFLACSAAGEDFAAFAPVAGAFYTDTGVNDDCSPSRSPLPMLEFHGLADNTIPYSGTEQGTGGPLPPIPKWSSLWAGRNKCVGKPEITDVIKGNPRNATLISYLSCHGIPGLLSHYKIGGMDHDWPSTSENSDNKKHDDGPTVIDASPIIMRFLEANHKPRDIVQGL